MKLLKKSLIAVMVVSIIIAVTGCGKSTGIIKIASKPMTEQYILTEILKAVIEDSTDLEVEIIKGIGGGTTNIQPALLKGDFDLYPEYTRTGWYTVLKKTENMEDSALYEEMQKEYKKLGLEWIGLYGFSNTYTLAIRKAVAEQYQIKTFSDLAAVSEQIVFGGNYDYIEKEDGYPLLCKEYNMSFKDTVDMEIALKYTAMLQGEVDVTNAFTTDAQLHNDSFSVLEDDKQFFSTYLAGTVVRQDTLKKYPKLSEALEKMTGIITESEMAAMNYDVEVNEKDEAVVAREFLLNKGIIKQ